MTIKEFQAWLEGYSESFTNGAPDKEQWQKVQTKLRSLSAFEYNPYGTYKPKKEWTYETPYIGTPSIFGRHGII